jgi:hypothetical protein
MGIVATGFCYVGEILQLFSLTRSANFTAADCSSQIGLHHQRLAQGSTPTLPLHRFDRIKMDLLGGLV